MKKKGRAPCAVFDGVICEGFNVIECVCAWERKVATSKAGRDTEKQIEREWDFEPEFSILFFFSCLFYSRPILLCLFYDLNFEEKENILIFI